MDAHVQWIAFEGFSRIARGHLIEVAREVKNAVDRGHHAPVLIFDDQTSEQIELDLRGTLDDVIRRIAEAPQSPPETPEPSTLRGPGRPKLGVVAREVTLLPRHWEWLNGQPGGASVALRKLVEEARKSNRDKDRLRQAQESAYRFIAAIAGNLPGFEEATRSLFAKDRSRFEQFVASWPADIRQHAIELAVRSFRESSIDG